MPEPSNIIDHDKCIRCSRCVAICPVGHLDLIADKIQLVDDPVKSCILCGHCMSVCPTQAMRTGDFNYVEFIDLPDTLPTLADFELLLKARRSTRRYTDKPVEKKDIEKILEITSTAPMGVPPSSVEIIVVNGKEKIQALFPSFHKGFKMWIGGMSSPIFKPIMGLMMGKYNMRQMETEIIPLAKLILEGAIRGVDNLTYDAPAMLLFHSSKYAVSYRENCLIATTFAMIAVEGLGLGSCIVGMIPPVIDRDKKLRGQLGIPKDNEVIGCLIVGHPKSTFNRTIPRKFKSVKWVS